MHMLGSVSPHASSKPCPSIPHPVLQHQACICKALCLLLLAMLLAGSACAEEDASSLPHVTECNYCTECVVDGAPEPAQRTARRLASSSAGLEAQGRHKGQGSHVQHTAAEGAHNRQHLLAYTHMRLPKRLQQGWEEDGRGQEAFEEQHGREGRASADIEPGQGHRQGHASARGLHQLPQHSFKERQDPGAMSWSQGQGAGAAAAAGSSGASGAQGLPPWRRWPQAIPRIMSATAFPERGQIAALISPPPEIHKAALPNCTRCRGCNAELESVTDASECWSYLGVPCCCFVGAQSYGCASRVDA